MTNSLIRSLIVSSLVMAGCGLSRPCAAPGPGCTAAADIEGELARILGIEDGRVFDADRLAALARHEDSLVRRWAVRAVGRLRDPQGMPIVYAALDDADPEVRAEAAFAAGLLRDTTATDLIARLATLVGDPAQPEPVQVEAVGALARLPTPAARAAIGRLLETPDVAPAVVYEALITAWRIPEPGSVLRLVVQHLDAEDPERRWRAAYSLMRSGDPSAIPALRRALADPDHRVREHAVRTLAASRAEAVGERDAAMRDLIRAVSDPHSHVRINAIRALGGYGDEAAAGVLHAAVRDPDPNVAVAAISALGAVPGDAAREALIRFAADDAASYAVRTGALAALLGRDLETALAHAAEWAASPDSRLRFQATLVLGTSTDPAARAMLETLADDDVARISAAARVRLGRIKPEDAVVQGPELPLEPPARDSAFYAAVVRRLVLPDLFEQRRPRVRVHTSAGSFVIELDAADAPLTVHNFLELARRGYFDGVRWHRVVPNFVIQGGDPTGTGSGGPGYAIRDEINRIRFTRAVVGMALSGPDTGGSQFFVTHSPQPHLDGDFTIFGRVVEGMDVVDRTVQDDRIEKIEIL